jgi:TolB-like protein
MSRVLAGCSVIGAAMAVLVARHATAQAPVSTATTSDRVLVMPFENVTHDGRLVWLSEAVAIGLTDALHDAGLKVISREERQEAFDRLQVPPAAVLTDATVLRLGRLVRASSVVLGTLRFDGDALVVDARDIVVDAARVRRRGSARGPVADLFATLTSVAHQVAPAGPAARSATASDRASRPPIEAFESYVKGLLADNPATAVTRLLSALAAQPTYDRARLALWDALTKQGDHKSALTALDLVAPTSPEYPRARFLVGRSLIEVQQLDEAYLVYQSLAERSPSPAVFNNRGVIQLRRSTSAGPSDTPSAYFKRASDVDAADSDFSSISATPTGRSATRRLPFIGFARRCAGIPLTVKRTTCSAPRSPLRGTPWRRTAKKTWRVAFRRYSPSGTSGQRLKA